MALILKGHYKLAFGITIVGFALTGKVSRLGGIPAYTTVDGYTQTLALTHAMLFFVAFALVVNRYGISSRFHQNILRSLVLFASIGTISQLFNHSFPDSILLSLGSLWVYVALSYTVLALFSGTEGIRQLAFIVTMSLTLGVMIRIASTGQGFFVTDLSDDFYRVDGFAFGPSISYAGYLAISAILSVALALSETSKTRMSVLLVLGLILGAEIASTGPRGAMLSLFLMPIGVIITRRYRLSAMILGAIGISVVALWPKISIALQARPIYFDGRVSTIPQWTERVELWRLNLPHVFDGFGFGHGIGQQLNLPLASGLYRPSHNTFLDLTQQVGAIATLVLIAIIIVVVIRGARESIAIRSPQTRTLAILVVTALTSWLFVANTTSTSLVWFYPVEGSSIFYITLCAAALVGRNQIRQ